MKFISRKAHAVLDYGSVLILIAAPFLFGFADIAPAMYTALCMAALIFLMSIFTDYEGGILKLLNMSFHVSVDVIMGIVLALSPWLFGLQRLCIPPPSNYGYSVYGSRLIYR